MYYQLEQEPSYAGFYIDEVLMNYLSLTTLETDLRGQLWCKNVNGNLKEHFLRKAGAAFPSQVQTPTDVVWVGEPEYAFPT